jgi:hypothetical protein
MALRVAAKRWAAVWGDTVFWGVLFFVMRHFVMSGGFGARKMRKDAEGLLFLRVICRNPRDWI